MEQTPADARAAPSASVPNDVDMGIASSPKRPRDPAQDNKAHHTRPDAELRVVAAAAALAGGVAEGHGGGRVGGL
eukprot:scaffold32517_cov105-Isochrysis_galbana.AAC.4